MLYRLQGGAGLPGRPLTLGVPLVVTSGFRSSIGRRAAAAQRADPVTGAPSRRGDVFAVLARDREAAGLAISSRAQAFEFLKRGLQSRCLCVNCKFGGSVRDEIDGPEAPFDGVDL